MASKLILNRGTWFQDRLRSYRIILDGKEIGTLSYNRTEEFEIPDGIHTLQVRIDWCGSPEVVFEGTGDTFHFECGNENGVASFFYTIFNRKNYLFLRPGNHLN